MDNQEIITLSKYRLEQAKENLVYIVDTCTPNSMYVVCNAVNLRKILNL